jgi:hypothetical protein
MELSTNRDSWKYEAIFRQPLGFTRETRDKLFGINLFLSLRGSDYGNLKNYRTGDCETRAVKPTRTDVGTSRSRPGSQTATETVQAKAIFEVSVSFLNCTNDIFSNEVVCITFRCTNFTERTVTCRNDKNDPLCLEKLN